VDTEHHEDEGQGDLVLMLVQFFKTMADETRLKIIGYLSQGEYRVSELAELLNLKEPTISHHLAKLREIELVNLRADANNRYYRLNTGRLEEMNRYLFQIENINPKVAQHEQDNAWIDALEFDEEHKKVLRSYVVNGRLKLVPLKEKKLLMILDWLVSHFEFGRRYTEKEVNAIIQQYHWDSAGLRRDMIIHGLLSRERDGSAYWRNTIPN
jgi:DNA-binding HxlR family transcriptional regulator